MNLFNKYSVNRIGRNRQKLLPWLNYTDAGLVTIADISTIGIPSTGLCTLLWKGTITTVGGATSQVLMQLDDTTANNVFNIRQTGTTTNLQAVRTNAAVAATTTLTTSTPENIEFRCGLSIYGDGTAKAAYNGAASNLTGGPTTGLNRLRFNISLVGSATLFRILPNLALSELDLINAVGGL